MACGCTAFLDEEHEGQSWLLRLQCELRHPDAADPRAVYVGTSGSAEDEEYAAFVRAVGRCGIRTCRRIDADLAVPAATLCFLEQSAVVWFGDTERPEHVWQAMVRDEEAGLIDRIRWRHQHGALLVGVGGGATLLGRYGFQSIKPGERPPPRMGEGPHRRVTFEALGCIDALVANTPPPTPPTDEEAPKDYSQRKEREEAKLVLAQLPLKTVGYVVPRDSALLSRHDGSCEAICGDVRKLVCTTWHNLTDVKALPAIQSV